MTNKQYDNAVNYDKELEWFLNELEVFKPIDKVDPCEQIQQDMIKHLTEIRELLTEKINQMEMRTKKIY
jgi:hypothetical protein